LFVLKNLPRLQERPRRLQEKVFEKLFSQAEVAKLNPEEMRAYDESQKIYWDNYSVLVTARSEARREGREEERLEVARRLKQKGIDLETIVEATGLTKEQVEKL
jgi:predicted transposase/invertase (TIGR01784 family)